MDEIIETERAKLVATYREVFNTDAGKKVLHDLCKACHIFHSTMDSTPHEMVYKEGARSVVLRIIKTIDINPFELDRLLKKHEKDN